MIHLDSRLCTSSQNNHCSVTQCIVILYVFAWLLCLTLLPVVVYLSVKENQRCQGGLAAEEILDEYLIALQHKNR